jgi:hypothetical protein
MRWQTFQQARKDVTSAGAYTVMMRLRFQLQRVAKGRGSQKWGGEGGHNGMHNYMRRVMRSTTIERACQEAGRHQQILCTRTKFKVGSQVNKGRQDRGSGEERKGDVELLAQWMAISANQGEQVTLR